MEKWIVKEGFSVSHNGKSYKAGEEIEYHEAVKEWIEPVTLKMLESKIEEKNEEDLPKKRSKK
jgi:hypothetical protein